MPASSILLRALLAFSILASPATAASTSRADGGTAGKPTPTTRSAWLGFGFCYYLDIDEAGQIRGWLGIGTIVPGSPAERAGLKTNDMVVEVNGTPLRYESELALLRFFERLQPKDKLTLSVVRGDETKVLHLVAGER